MKYYVRLNEQIFLPTLVPSKHKSALQPSQLTLWCDCQCEEVEKSPLKDYLLKLDCVEDVLLRDVDYKAPGTTIIDISQARRPQREWEPLIQEVLFLIKVVCCKKGEGLEEQPNAPYQEP